MLIFTVPVLICSILNSSILFDRLVVQFSRPKGKSDKYVNVNVHQSMELDSRPRKPSLEKQYITVSSSSPIQNAGIPY